MTEWTVVGVIIALVGLFFTIGKPIINLNGNIIKLNVSMEAANKRADKQERDLEEQKRCAHESHQKLWEHNAQQDETLREHEARIGKLENK
jgi:hypothetical protein